ncbi:hypothetical protein LTR44_003383 [Exophiala sp. CCFEE 6388]|uniref:Xylanolytic transcriptional activator regulatory domain-containing protein n=1 Tax=Exophiala sideris TaxID=1016849 RepID=A0ABR0JDJ9_9EURO|nr:hypothetical protein LTR69_005192 [Exophiala sideris]KAK5184708.1 hypothetical protein LTR44_003383 [Eurotiomycetes sp. CCFEE 6388]
MYMPNVAQCVRLLKLTRPEYIHLRRQMLEILLETSKSFTAADAVLNFDDAVAVLVITSIGPLEPVVDFQVNFWLSFLRYVVKSQNLFVQAADRSPIEMEERRRLWWATYIIDRHSSLALNLRPTYTDASCPLHLPSADDNWLQNRIDSPAVFDYHVATIDLFGLFIPLMRILGGILEYHHLRSHPIFGAVASLRANIEDKLIIWGCSFHGLLGLGPQDLPTSPLIACYAYHIYHCLYVLLYGLMDLVSMYENTEWQASRDFILAGEHAMACASDPELSLMSRLFGTYLLQASFIFLFLARKLPQTSKSIIIENCEVNMTALEVIAKKTNMEYQRHFARLLQQTIERDMNEQDEDLGEDLLRYRWIAGHNGLRPLT